MSGNRTECDARWMAPVQLWLSLENIVSLLWSLPPCFCAPPFQTVMAPSPAEIFCDQHLTVFVKPAVLSRQKYCFNAFSMAPIFPDHRLQLVCMLCVPHLQSTKNTTADSCCWILHYVASGSWTIILRFHRPVWVTGNPIQTANQVVVLLVSYWLPTQWFQLLLLNYSLTWPRSNWCVSVRP